MPFCCILQYGGEVEEKMLENECMQKDGIYAEMKYVMFVVDDGRVI